MRKRRSFIPIIRWSVLALLLVFIFVCRCCPQAGEWYARHIYPHTASFLSGIASAVSFSLEEVLAVVAACSLLGYPFFARRHGTKWKNILRREGEAILWLYAWFYWGWGMNYFRESFYERAGTKPAAYDETKFQAFLRAYTDSLNASYCKVESIDTMQVWQNIRTIYRQVPARYGLQQPKSCHVPKNLWFNTLYSSVGVLGYAGPFFVEMQLNKDLLPSQYPFTYAHELAHLLGINSEAEANYWAYQACIRSESPETRYSGYMGLLPYVIVNARAVMDKDEYHQWALTLRDEVVRELGKRDVYWQERYSHTLGLIQDKIYDLFLKGNQIPTGKKNYAEVIQMILSH